MITVLRAGPLTTVQDLGRPGWAHLGVPRSGALDQPALRRANLLVGNDPDAAVLETTLLGCRLRFEADARIAVTGATATVKVNGEPKGGEVFEVSAGGVVDVGRALKGVRSYVAVAGGITVEPVLGSRSTDTLSGLGPPRLADGMTLPIGAATSQGRPSQDRPSQGAAISDIAHAVGDALMLDVWPGPRDDWFAAGELFVNEYTVSPVSNRVGARLTGPDLTRTQNGELASEGVVLGAIQVPSGGQPLIFLADHPTTGGYPVIGVVADVSPLAQARPGSTVRFRAID